MAKKGYSTTNMETVIDFVTRHAHQAHWFLFGAILLAGLNIPLSIDLIVALGAVLAATLVPENTIKLWLFILMGCCLSAWIAYGVGRTFGPLLQKKKWFLKILPPKRLANIKRFYEKHGFLTLAIGRFIPFGVRNCLFMTAGISKMPFHKFILRDFVASCIWCTTAFYLFFTLGQNFEVLGNHLKTFNIFIFAAFSVTVIGFVWYKKRKKAKINSTSETQ
jgi:membrane protein DedA with SNARE-associated domain